MAGTGLFADIILPLYLHQTLTYAVPDEYAPAIAPGKRVLVQLGKQKIYSGIVLQLHNNNPGLNEIKNIISVIDDYPVVTPLQIELWQWISQYYLCTLGETMAAALPSALKLHSETTIVLNTELNENFLHLTEQEYIITETLQDKKALTLKEISRLVDRKNVFHIVQSLLNKNLVYVKEDVVEKFKPKLATFLIRSENANEESFLHEQMNVLEKKSPKQLDLLMHFLKLEMQSADKKIEKGKLLKASGLTDAVLNGLIKKNILQLVKEKKENNYTGAVTDSNELSLVQQEALQKTKALFAKKQTVLLHGITSSGKTEVYIKLIEEYISQGKQVLYLLPEIALTTQIISRLRKFFGDNLLVYHSRFNETERAATWNKLLEISLQPHAKAPVIIGARSAVFLPFSNLGLVIVDEEHEQSYKQHEPAPRYHARDTAMVLAQKFGARTLLGSATPSFESYNNVKEDKYGLVEINLRHGNIDMPDISLVNIKELSIRKLMKSHFSPALLAEIKTELDKGKQIILFQNRRGFAPIIECNQCSWVPHCVNCDVALTYYKRADLLRCHYCGYSTQNPSRCNNCGDTDLRQRGFGTEKIEDELQIFFPDKKIARLDLDATRAKHAYRQIIESFENHETHILVGTQMITKGLDFGNVSLVGILNADSLINFPDFRSFERSFQLMLQVSGRAGRKGEQGKVIIQTYNPEQMVLKYLIQNDYRGFYAEEIQERKRFQYPPFYRLIEITLKHRDERLIENAATAFAKELKKSFGSRVLGPTSPYVSKVKNMFIKSILVKTEKQLPFQKAKHLMVQSIEKFRLDTEFKNVIIICDVDPF